MGEGRDLHPCVSLVIRLSMSPPPPPTNSGGHQPPRPPRSNQAVVMSVTDMETAVDARLALEHCEDLREAVGDLNKRVGHLESVCTATGEARGHRTTIIVAVIGVVGTLVVGVVLWALNTASTPEIGKSGIRNAVCPAYSAEPVSP
jgi:hypothetical protein